ncbi:ABC transporter ATP-binding protein [Candidatus Desulfarcum epimagneticum]|uniref:ABC transporter ATP-binding protein n=1 Tax=uncultured Desulfobacteraceae bacterium TaxID=218296 RepID=A0A484HCX5_9BACT|nr:ABC transporter ATP-binding protein [uncultured Desulfobacteraceae bacterium]
MEGRKEKTIEYMLETQNLMVFYENALAVNNVDMKARKGKITGIFGANSAGKSTLMYALSGIILDIKKKEKMRGGERVSVLGDIRFNGEDVTRLKASLRAKKGLVLCPERRRVFSESSTLTNLKMGGYLANRAQRSKTLDYVFALFPNLKRWKRKAAGFLSGGEQQMLAFGRALMAQPKLLLLDEPLMGLSPLMEEKLVDAIRDINTKTGVTVVVAEQYARPILPVINFGYVLENGAVVLEGSGRELMENPDMKAAYFGI